MNENTKRIPTYKLGDIVKVELEVSDQSGVDKITAAFSSVSGRTTRFYLRGHGEGKTSGTVILTGEVVEGTVPGVYKLDWVDLKDILGNSTLVTNLDISFRVADYIGDHEGPQVTRWRVLP